MMKAILYEIKKCGYKAEEVETIKNGVIFHGISIGSETIRPVIYIDDFIGSNLSNAEIAEKIIEVYKEAKKHTINKIIKQEKFQDWNYVKDNIQLCIQKKSEEKILKRDFLDLEIYVRILLYTDDMKENLFGATKVLPEMLKAWGLNEDEILEIAWKNTKPTLSFQNAFGMIVASNESKVNGAIAMLNVDGLKELSKFYNSDLVIIPSSIHEVIIEPLNILNVSDLNNMDIMVKDVNTTLDPEEILSEHVYIFEKDTEKIVY